jgi:AraC family transcriptional regulator of arabinose operon
MADIYPERVPDYRQKSYYMPQDVVLKESENFILRNLLLTWTGIYTKAYGHLVQDRVLQDYVLIYCIDGKGWLSLEGRNYDINRGDLFVCPPGIPHSYGADKEDPWTKYWIHFRGSNAKDYMSILQLTLESPVLNIGIDSKIITWVQEVFNILDNGYVQCNLLHSTSFLNNILTRINYLKTCSTGESCDEMAIDKVIAYMLNNIYTNLTLTDIAQYASLSKYHFSRVFKKKTQYTPVDYFMRLKMQKACELLESSKLSINKISAMLAFINPYYFSITFKRVIGKSPKHYRQMAFTLH